MCLSDLNKVVGGSECKLEKKLNSHSLDIEFSVSRLYTDFHLVCRNCGVTWRLKPKYFIQLSIVSGIPYLVWPLIALGLWGQFSSPSVNIPRVLLILIAGVSVYFCFTVLPRRLFYKRIMKSLNFEKYFDDFVNFGCQRSESVSNYKKRN